MDGTKSLHCLRKHSIIDVPAVSCLTPLLSLCSFLYWFFQAQDANFRLKGRHRSTKMEDVTLSPGWSYFVEHKAYKQHVLKFANQEEVHLLPLQWGCSNYLVDQHLRRLRCNPPSQPQENAWPLCNRRRWDGMRSARDVASERIG